MENKNKNIFKIFGASILIMLICMSNVFGTITMNDNSITDDTLGLILSFDNDYIDFANATFTNNISIGNVNINDTRLYDDTLGTIIDFDNDYIDLNNGTFTNSITVDGRVLDTTDFNAWDVVGSGNYDPTLIWNSNGNNWTATLQHIKDAIYDLDNSSGTVWLPGNTSIICSSGLPIQLYDGIKLDGGKCILDIRQDANVIQPEPYSEICNLIIDVSYMVNDLASDYTSSCIYIDGTHEFNTRKSLYIHDIEFIGEDGGWSDYCTGNAIKLYGPAGKNCYSALITDCWIRNFGNAILISALATSSIQQNIFSNFDIHNCIHGVVINGGGYDTCGLNLFENFNIQPYTWSLDAFHIEGEQNEIANFICADASTFVNDTAVIHITSVARKTKVDCNLEKSAILDEQSVDNAYKGTITTNNEHEVPYINCTGHSGANPPQSAISTSHINPNGNWGRWGSVAQWYTFFYNFRPDGTTTFIRQYGGNTGEYMQLKVDTVTATISTIGLNIILDPPAGKFVGINDSTPSYELDVTGDIHCTGKLTSDGGNDPPYVLYNYETRQSTIDRVKKEVPDDKLNGCVLFYNGPLDRLEYYFPERGIFRDTNWNIVAIIINNKITEVNPEKIEI